MTVRELKDILDACNDDNQVLIKYDHLAHPLGVPFTNNQVFQDGTFDLVTIDLTAPPDDGEVH